MHPGVIECSPPKVNGNFSSFKISLFIFEIVFSALFIFLSILKKLSEFLSQFFYKVHISVLHRIKFSYLM